MSDDHHHHHDHEDNEKLLKNEDFQKARKEMRQKLWVPGQKPSTTISLSRRIFVHKALLAGGAAAMAFNGWLPRINTFDIAVAQEGQPTEPFRFAWISDTHLYPKEVNTKFIDNAVRAVREVQAMDPPVDFLIFGGDLAQLGDPVELELGAEILKEIKAPKYFIPGEHDWYLDMGATWNKMFGTSPWTFDHKGVRFIGLDTVSRAMDFWTARKMSPKERMGVMATLDGGLGGAWAGVGMDGLDFLNNTLADWPKDAPVVIFTHNPLYEYYPPWNFCVRDWQLVHEVLKPYTNVTNLHGHCHQVLYHEIGTMRSIGMLATSWPWPYAPENVPELTVPMVRVHPGEPSDGVGWGLQSFNAESKAVEYEYKMWRKDIFAEATVDSGTGDNPTQVNWPRPEGR